MEILLSRVIDSSTNQVFLDDIDNLANKIATIDETVSQTLMQPDEEEPDKTLKDTKGIKQIIEDLLGQINEDIHNLNVGITSILSDAINDVNNYLKDAFKTNIEIFIKNVDNYVSLDEENNVKKELFLELRYYNNKIENQSYQAFLNEARLSALAICIYLAAVKSDNPAEDNLKILFLDDIFIGLDTSNRIPLLEILKNDFYDFQIFITTYDRYWYELASEYLGSSWKKAELYCGAISEKQIIDGVEKEINLFEVPVLIQENLELYEKAQRYFEAYDYYAAGNYLRKIFEKRIEELTHISFHIEENDLEGHIKKLHEYYIKCNCENLIDDDLLRELKLFKNILLNPSSHHDLKCPLYKLEIEKAFKVVDKLLEIPKIERELIVGKGASLFYRNSEKNYSAEYRVRENLYKINLSDGSKRLTNPLHKLERWALNSVNFCDKKGIGINEHEIERIKSIEMNLKKELIK